MRKANGKEYPTARRHMAGLFVDSIFFFFACGFVTTFKFSSSIRFPFSASNRAGRPLTPRLVFTPYQKLTKNPYGDCSLLLSKYLWVDRPSWRQWRQGPPLRRWQWSSSGSFSPISVYAFMSRKWRRWRVFPARSLHAYMHVNWLRVNTKPGVLR